VRRDQLAGVRSASGGKASAAAWAGSSGTSPVTSSPADPVSSLDALRGRTPPSAARNHCGPLTGNTEAQYAANLAGVKQSMMQAAVADGPAAQLDMTKQLQAAEGMRGTLVSTCHADTDDDILVTRLVSSQAAQRAVEQPFINSPTSIYDQPYPPWQPLDSGPLGNAAHCATKVDTLSFPGADQSALEEACTVALGSYITVVSATDRGDVGVARVSPGVVAQTVAVRAWLEAGGR
jgi:hypothetical protein